jgi:hypothetical protein
LDYIRDILLEPGKVSDLGSNYVWRISYMSKLDLKRAIANAEAEGKRAKAEKRDSYSSWNVDVLKEIYDVGPKAKDQRNKNLTEREKALAATHFTFATVYHRGVEAPFMTFSPSVKEKMCRTRTNENPTGDIPITLMYHTQDLVNPYGKGAIEVAGANQNVLDHFTQADVLATQKGMAPPIKVGGPTKGLVMRTITHGPHAIWKVGDAKVDVVETHSSVYQYLGERIGRYKSSLMNQLGVFDTSVSASSGDPQFSKTDAGVNALESRGDVNDNFAANNGRIAFRRLAKNLMNIHMANMEGQEVFDMLEDEVERLEKAGWIFGGSRKANLVYKDLKGKFDFQPDEKRQASDPEKAGLLEGIKALTESETAIPAIEADGKYRVDLGEAYRQYFEKLNLSKIDKIIVPTDTEDSMPGQDPDEPSDQATDMPIAPEDPTSQQQQAAPAPDPSAPKAPTVSIPFRDLPVSGKIQAAAASGIQLQPDDFAMPAGSPPEQPVTDQPGDQIDPTAIAEQIVQTYGLDEAEAQVIIAAIQSGVTPEEIVASIEKGAVA